MIFDRQQQVMGFQDEEGDDYAGGDDFGPYSNW